MTSNDKMILMNAHTARLLLKLTNDVDWLMRYTIPEQVEICRARADLQAQLYRIEQMEIAWAAKKAVKA